MSAAVDRAQKDFQEKLAAAKLAASRAVEACRELADVSRSLYRNSPILAAGRLVDAVGWVERDEALLDAPAPAPAEEK